MEDCKPEVNRQCTRTKGRSPDTQSFLLLKVPLTSGLTVTLRSGYASCWCTADAGSPWSTMASASVFQHASAKHPPPDVTWDIWETQSLPGAARG